MAETHYDTLGLARSATAGEIKTAYRLAVMKHHPDRSKDPKSPELFLKATEAYETLSDPARRQIYDETLDLVARRLKEIELENLKRQQYEAAHRPPAPDWSTPAPPVSAQVQKLAVAFKQGRLADAEKLAQEIRSSDPRQPLPYAILGDIARSRGRMNEAAKMYAYAVQFDPRNPVYERRYEELLAGLQVVTDSRSTVKLASNPERLGPLWFAGGVAVFGALVAAFSPEEALLKHVTPISTWTVGLTVALFLSGVAVGSAMAAGNLLDRFGAGRAGPSLALGTIAIVNFWAAVLLYSILGAAQQAFNYSASRLFAGIAAVTVLIGLGALVAGKVSPGQVLLWGGNLTYLGAVAGWFVTDTIKSGSRN